MINIQKTGNAIVVDFTDNDKYLNNGTIEVAPNELMVVIDDSNMATFKKMSNGDTLFGQLIDQIKIQGEAVTKENIIEKFGTIGFSISSGGGEGGAVNSVNGQTGDVVITATSLGAITKADADTLYAAKSDLNSKQDTLVSGQNIKTINGQSVIGEGNIEIQQSELPIASANTLGGVKVGAGLSINPESGVLSANSPEWNNISGKPEDIVNITERLASKLDTATYNSEKSSFATKDELNSKADASAITDMATQTWVQNQGYLTEVPSNYVTNSELTEGLAGKQDIGDYALKSDLNTLATKEELATKADATALSSKQDTLVSGTNIKTINGETILGSGNLVIQSGTSNWDDIQGKPQFAVVATSGNYNDLTNKPTIPDVSGLATKQEIADMETKSNAAATYATKQEIPSLEGYLTETVASETYATKQALGNKLDTATYNSEKAGFETKENAAATYQVKGDYATKQEIAGKQDTLVSGTNIKTINGNSVLGAGDITIQAGGTVDTAMSDTSENAVQNKVIKKYIDDLVGNILTQLQEINGTIA